MGRTACTEPQCLYRGSFYGLIEARQFKINLPSVVHDTVALKNSLSYSICTYVPVANLNCVFCVSFLLPFTYCASITTGHVLLTVKVHPCTGTEALYSPYGPEGE